MFNIKNERRNKNEKILFVSAALLFESGFNKYFDKIIFMPAFCPPHKETLDFYHRYNMVKLAVDEPYLEVSDLESKLEAPSYSYRTASRLFEDNGGKIPFIIGYDAFINIEKWKNPEILKEKIEFIVLKRRENGKDAKEEAEFCGDRAGKAKKHGA